ncbi:SOS response-associated peptidase [Mesorhizobium sp. CA18]|uniref:SOS response-associated peptidase n=1 Tax=unclassified Mesorhizobium TaxID=325217 RepID=UPI001CCB0AD5|nr:MULTISPECIES: SOS response-associated peptidase [unclassified Mesorhizobium]MBZ9736782.1 SOS response-associated peptidase [Mesorhizobium sp. CA9]MBZ9825325.1 SOS response-associated peptidase [Mesorhizobium sp. CA18]MBZ9834054.1 SOS response-associated peptidase [Mesorhizobium sp. CA2]MBZ9836482.1 SOS response-associated peptidase [Mesorhizobium sp. CA3]MBZ9878102.1 SOS response-associated peptidase [Mesorhizobium sp. Ca11]
MCGRFALTATPDQTAALLGLAELEEFPARYNIAPTQPVLMALAGPQREPSSNLPDRQAMLVRWGLIPTWVEDTKAFPLLINARSEGVLQKASFKTAMRHRRALVPASGFYEWQQSGGKKGQPYWIRPKRGGVIAFAGLIETYSEPGGSEMDTGAIITTEANAGIAHIHDRMPVVIEECDFARWLDCRTQEPRDVLDLLKPAEPDFFEAIPVSDLVNKVANTGPEIQERGVVGPQAEKPRRQKPGADENQMTLF